MRLNLTAQPQMLLDEVNIVFCMLSIYTGLTT